MTLLLSLLVLAVALTLLAVVKARGARPREAVFPLDDPRADVSRPRAHLDAIVRTGSAVDRVHLSGLWAQERGDHTRIRPKYAKGFQRR